MSDIPFVVMNAFDRYAQKCPHRCEAEAQRRPANALNVEVGTPAARCTAQPPSDWRSGMVLRWIGSGGSVLVFGRCSVFACPLSPRFCADCGHRSDAGHALGVCRTHSEGPGGSWPCGCDTFRACSPLAPAADKGKD